MDPGPDDPVLTTREAAAILKISPRGLLDSDAPWFPAGGGEHRPHRRYLRSALLEWARARQITGSSDTWAQHRTPEGRTK